MKTKLAIPLAHAKIEKKTVFFSMTHRQKSGIKRKLAAAKICTFLLLVASILRWAMPTEPSGRTTIPLPPESPDLPTECSKRGSALGLLRTCTVPL